MDSTHRPLAPGRAATAADAHMSFPASGRPALAGSSGKKVTNGLVALGSAAVIAIYTTGYLRTKPAADRLDAAQRRMPVPLGSRTISTAEPVLRAAPAVPPDSLGLVPDASAGDRTPTLALPTTPASLRPAASASLQEPVRGIGTAAPVTPPAPVKVATPTSTVASSQATPAASTTPPVAATEPSTAATPDAAVASAAAASDSTSASTPAAAPVVSKGMYKDGSYSGWGTSRHGDIEATVTIEGGRIKKAVISQCLTRYSCNWIDPLPPQVLVRQNAEIDTVSGATQSTYAFYYALVEALAKAK